LRQSPYEEEGEWASNTTMGVEEGEALFTKNLPPSPFKERGIKGVR
jgi:hypothetical protein